MRYFVTILLIFMLSGQAVGVAVQSVHGAPRQGVIPPGQEAVQSGKELPSYQETAEAVAHDPTFAQAYVGICVMDGNGKVLARVNADKMLVPASNMKLITTGAALHMLGPSHTFETSLAYDGNIEGGTLRGNLHIVGGGDPTLGSKDSIATPVERTFAVWGKMLRDAGIRRIEGHIIGDGRSFEGMMEEPTWLWNDTGTYYGAGVSGLMFYENMQSFSVSAGPEIGAPVNIKPYYPDCPWMDFRYACSTGKAGTGDRLYMYTSDLAPVAEIRGTFGVDRAAKRVDCANKYPEYTCARYFENYLRRKGISCSGGAADYKLITGWMTEEAGCAGQGNGTGDRTVTDGEKTLIGSTLSPTLDRIVFETNHASNNVFAETLFRTLGKTLHESACYDSSYVALNDALAELGVSTGSGIKVQDGSGLSRQNLVSPEFLCRFLHAMSHSPAFGDFLESLPSPGFNGTLEYNMKGQPEALRRRIKVKSGSMNGVRCYSGYILPSYSGNLSCENGLPEGTLIISIMTNNCTSPNWKVRPLLDRFMAALARGN